MKKNRKIGSGILVVILSSIAFSIYAMSTFSEVEHFHIVLDRYEKNNREIYQKYGDKISKQHQENDPQQVEEEDIIYQ